MSVVEKFCLFVISLFFVLIHSDGIFFWDNIAQLSVPADYYFDNGLSNFFIPDEIATGHQTFVAAYLALGWKIFGKNLLVSHLLMVPFVYGILLQLYRFISKFLDNKKHIYIILFLTVLDAAILSQLSLITFEKVHIFFLLWAINTFIENRKTAFIIAFAGLCLVSLRSTMSAIGLGIFVFIYPFITHQKWKFETVLLLVPGFFLFAIFLLTFYFEKGWIIHNTVSNSWSESSEYASLQDMAKNTVIIFKNLGDYGRIYALAGSGLLVLLFFFERRKFSKVDKILLALILSQFIIFYLTTVIYRNSISMRYFIPVSLFITLFFLISVFRNFRKKYTIAALALISTINGYFWSYPINIASNWDCTPAHWPYYDLRKKMKDYIVSKKINTDEVGTFFPNARSFKVTELSRDQSGFANVDFNKNRYIFFSNVYNVDDEALQELFNSSKWKLIKQFSNGKIFVSLYERLE